MSAKKTEEQDQTLSDVVAAIEKKYGRGTIIKLSEQSAIPIPVIPTGSLALDLALGVGGIPRGRVTELYGAEGSGKSTLCLHLVAQVQREGGNALYVDLEHSFDPAYARACGIRLDDLHFCQPASGEEALQIVDSFMRSGAVSLIVIDSVAAITPLAEIEGDIGDQHVGRVARLMSQTLRQFVGTAHRSTTALVFVNQLREKVGQMSMHGGPMETTPGGRALKFFASIRLELRRRELVKEGDAAVGLRVKAKVAKSKVSTPFREAEFVIVFGHGIDRTSELLDIGVEKEVLRKAGSFYYYGETRLGQGREAARQYLLEHAETAAVVEAAIRTTLGGENTANVIKIG